MKGTKKLEEVTFRPAKGGHSISSTRFKTARGGQGGGPSFDYNSEETMHPTAEHAAKHLAKVFHAEAGTDKEGAEYNETDRGGPEVKAGKE